MSGSAGHSWPPALDQAPPPPEHYREVRPVRAWLVVAGFGGTLLLYVLVAVASWTTTVLLVGLTTMIAALSAVSFLLLRRGDRGVAVGSAMMTGSAATVLVFVLLITSLVSP